MNSNWIEQQARQHIHEFAADARGDQLIRDADAPASRRMTFGRRPVLGPRAWLNAFVARSRRPVARVR
jgi:hypothetical protein